MVASEAEEMIDIMNKYFRPKRTKNGQPFNYLFAGDMKSEGPGALVKNKVSKV